MLPFSSSESSYPLPPIGKAEARILERFMELYRGNDVLDKLIEAARRKMRFDEASVRFWAPLLVEGRLGPLEPFLKDDEIEEIMVNGIGKEIFVYHRKKGMMRTGIKIESSDYFLELANRMLAELGRRVSESKPRANGVLANGDRVSVVIPPYSRDFVLDIRRFSAEPLTVIDLVESGMLTYEEAAFLWIVFERGGVDVGIVGNTSSGKTTLLNALLRFVPKHSRMVLVEEVPEIKPLQDQVIHLLSIEDLGIDMKSAIIDSMRLRPDRTVIGEVRSREEVEALRESTLAGQSLATYFTYHAENIEHARKRLVSQGFPSYDLEAIDLFVVCRRSERKGRIMREVVEIGGKERIFERGEMVREPEGLGKEIERRARWLRRAGMKRDRELFLAIQGEMGYV